jgi:Carboxypeptidase regulatory-like domain
MALPGPLGHRTSVAAAVGLLLAAALAVVLGPLLSAQSNTGSIYGRTADQQGLRISGAVITVRSSDLSSARTVSTDGSGNFTVTGLVPGAYVVEAHGHGLVLRPPVHLTIRLGSSTQLMLRLTPQQVHQGAIVTAARATSEGNTVVPPVDRTEPSISNFLPGTVVTYLPNRDRDVAQFGQLSANAHEDSDGAGVVIDGQRPAGLLIQVDGVDFNVPLFGDVAGPEVRSFFLPQTVIREFEIVSSGASADIGQTTAGYINAATKEGSNKFHGEAFYTLRPSALTSTDAFGDSLNSFQSNYGGSFGGSIRKDRAFFYTGFEQDFLHAPRFVLFESQAPAVGIPAALAQMEGQIVEKSDPIAYSGRIDQMVNAANTLNIELAFNRIRVSDVGDGLTRSIAAQTNSASLGGRSAIAKVALTTVLGARSVNQALAAWSSDHIALTPNAETPELFINGFGILGGSALGPHLFTAQQFELSDSVSVARGVSNFDLGAGMALDPAYEDREGNQNGRFDYNSLGDYLAGNPRRFQQTFIVGNTRYSGTVRELSVYGDGHLELRHSLSLAAGLRWAAQWNPQPPAPNSAIPQTVQIPSDWMQWQPRLGLAWNPGSRTDVRLSAGLYDAPTPATFFHRIFADDGRHTIVADSYFDPELVPLTGASAGSPHALSTVPAGLSTPASLVMGIDSRFRNPRSLQIAATVDQIVSPRLTLRGGLLHQDTWRLQRVLDENLNRPVIAQTGLSVFPTARPISGLGRLLINYSSAHSSYSSVNFSVLSQISHRSEFTLNYTLSQTHDDDSNIGPYGIVPAIDPFDLKNERGYSALDMRQILNLSAILNLPLGFKCNPLLIVHSAPPYTAIVGYDTQNDANDFNDRAIVDGHVTPRNIFRQPAFSNEDLRIVKDITLKGEGHHFDLFMDVFNIANNSNRSFGPEQVGFYGTPTMPVPSAGQALFAPDVTRVGGPREIQFTARLVAF